jgi:hypothetical protein
MVKALTLWEPWAALVSLNIKTIETRSWPTNYRGHLIVHAGTRWGPGCPDGATCHHSCKARCWRTENCSPLSTFPQDTWPDFPSGAIVATAELIDCVPMHDTCTNPIPDDLCYVTVYGLALFRQQVIGDPSIASNVVTTDLTDQLPYGDFSLGRWAWLLDDIKPITERCPACWGFMPDGTPIAEVGYYRGREACPTCDGMGTPFRPIRARGRQRLWNWSPDV